MRKNTQAVFSAWTAGRYKTFDSIKTNGAIIWSYETKIVWPATEAKNRYVFDLKNYSPTTSRQQNDLLALMRIHGILPRVTIINAPDPPAKQLAMFDPKEGG